MIIYQVNKEIIVKHFVFVEIIYNILNNLRLLMICEYEIDVTKKIEF